LCDRGSCVFSRRRADRQALVTAPETAVDVAPLADFPHQRARPRFRDWFLQNNDI